MKQVCNLLLKLLLLVSLAVLFLGAIPGVSAADIVASGNCGGEGDGTNLTWTLDAEGLLTITGNGPMKDYSDSYSPWKDQAITIVKVANGVTSIGGNAFAECSSLTGIALPDSVTSIGARAFYQCSSLTSIMIPDGVTSIEMYAFYGCGSLTSITLPDSVKSIGAAAFYQCGSLTSITLPDSVKSIGAAAFYQCDSLTSIMIPTGVTSVEASTFYGCDSLTSITLPDSVTSIGTYAFYNCSSLTSITLPDNVTSIGEAAFYYCSSLRSITIPNSVTSIEARMFSNCSSLTSITLPDSVTGIGTAAFYYCSSLRSITIPNSVTSIGWNAFNACSSLRSITISNSVTSIGGYAFSGCSSLRSITIPNSVTSIGVGAFYACSGLTSITIQDGVTSIGSLAFYNCSSLVNITIPNSVTSIGGNATFSGCSSLTSITIPNGVTSIGEKMFEGCSSLRSITIPNSVTSIGWAAFSDCSSLRSITIPNSVTSIEKYAFSGCSNLTSITIPDSVTSIADSAFSDCTKLVIYCNNGSYAHTYAVDNRIPYVLTDQPDNSYIPIIPIFSGGTSYTVKSFVYEYSTLKRLQDVSITCEDGSLAMSLSGYYPVDIPSCTLSIDKRIKLTLVPESNGSCISAVHCKGKDALCSDLTISSEEKALDIYVYSTLSADEISRYDLMQDGSTIQSSTTGQFSINPSKITYDKPLSVRVVRKDGTKCPKIKTNITVHDNIGDIGSDISIGTKIKFGIPEDIPLIGGGEVSLDFSLLPVVVETEGDAFRIGIGCSQNLLKKDNSWDTFKKFIETQNDNYRKGINNYLASKFGKATAGPEGNFQMEVYGYVEGSISGPGKFSQVEGCAVIRITGKLTQEWQAMIVVVPVVVKFEAEAGVKTSIALGFDFDNAEIYFDGEITLTLPELTISGGVGIAYVADISVYGSAENKLKLGTKSSAVTATLSGEIGASAKAMGFSYEKAFLKGDWQYYHSGSAQASQTALASLSQGSFAESIQSADQFAIDRSYVDKQSGWLADTGDETPVTLQTSVYNSADPQIVITDNGLKMMIWTADITTRTTGNHTAVVYSIYDETAKTWTEPAILDDDGTADFYPDVATDGENIYVVWMDCSRSDFDADSSLTDVAASCDISAAVYSPASGSFTVSTLTGAAGLDFCPVVEAVNGTVYAAWCSNSQNDLLTLAGTNILSYTSCDGTAWEAAQTISSYEKPVSGLTIGNAGGTAAVAFLLDTDGDPTTKTDLEVCAAALGKTPAALTGNTTPEQSLQFARIAGSPVLAWYEDGNLCYTADLSSVNTITAPSAGLTTRFRILDCDGTSVILGVGEAENGTELYQYSLNAAGIGEPVSLTSTGEYIHDFSAAYYNSVIYTAYTQTAATITSETVEESTDLCVMTVGTHADLVLESVSANQEDVADGAGIPVELTVRNNGTADESRIHVTAQLLDKTKLDTDVDVDLPAGETRTITVTLPLESTVGAKSVYTWTITPNSGTDRTADDNSRTLTIGYADLQLTAELVKSGGARAALVTVDNTSCIGTQATLRVRSNSSEGTVLATYDLGLLAGNSSTTWNISSEALPDLLEQDTTLYFEVVATEEELCASDNNDFLYLPTFVEERAVQVIVNGTVYTFDSLPAETGTVIAAVYDGNGKMLGSALTNQIPTEADAQLRMTIAGLPENYRVRVFFLNSAWAPITEAMEQGTTARR